MLISLNISRFIQFIYFVNSTLNFNIWLLLLHMGLLVLLINDISPKSLENLILSTLQLLLLFNPRYQRHALDVKFLGYFIFLLNSVIMPYLCWFDIYPVFSKNNSRLGYFNFSLLWTIFFAFRSTSFFALYNITSVLFFDLHRLECFLGYDRRIIALS